MAAAGTAPVLRDVWDRQSRWSQTAGALKRRLTRARTGVLALTVLGALLSTTAAVVGLGEPVGKWLAFGAAAAAGLAGVGRLVADPRAVQDWTRARSVSEAIKAEVFTYLMCAGDYTADERDDLLDQRVADFEKESADLLQTAHRFQPRPRDTPAVDSPESYAQERVAPQMGEYYDRNAAALDRKIRRVRAVEVGLAAAGALLAAAAGTWEEKDLAVWVPVVTTVTAAIAAHAAAERYEFLRLEYSRTARQLERLLAVWRRGKLSDDAFVLECEALISNQNDAWMAKLSSEDDDSS